MANRVWRVGGWTLAVTLSLAARSGVRAFGCSGVRASRRSGVQGQPLPAPTPPNARTPERLNADWAHWWHSRHRPRTERRTFLLHGRPVAFVGEAVPPGWQYPCTPEELEAALSELPAAWTARLRSVRFTYHPEWGLHARTDRSRIEISYVVDAALRAPALVHVDSPEELQFGARLETDADGRRLVWPDRETLRVYLLRHILIHELGHHVAPPGLPILEEEAWAEAFAYRYFTPLRRRQPAVFSDPLKTAKSTGPQELPTATDSPDGKAGHGN